MHSYKGSHGHALEFNVTALYLKHAVHQQKRENLLLQAVHSSWVDFACMPGPAAMRPSPIIMVWTDLDSAGL